MNTRITTAGTAVIFTFIGAALAGGYTYANRDDMRANATQPAVAEAATPSGPSRNAPVSLPDFAEIAAKQGAAVVNVSVSGTVKTGASVGPGSPKLDPNDPFSQFFRQFPFPSPHEGIPTQGQGSGFIVDANGVILTNAHVVAGADEVVVKLTDRREFKAKVLGSDKPTDVAVLKIDAKNLPAVRIGNSQRARVGEWVVAIGAPFGFENSVTAGIISAKSRSLPNEGYVPFLQTDVAINPGNSGGPLFDSSGEVIGINSQIYSRSGGYQGLSFAIPIEVAMKVERQLLEHGRVERGRLGVLIQELNKDLADSFGLERPVGALVSSVERGGPADKAGIEPGDVILKFNGKEISNSAELPPLVADFAPGTAARIELWRKGRTKEISVNVGASKLDDNQASKAPERKQEKLGLALRPLTPDELRDAEVAGGLLVERVVDGPAARAGIQAGDIILSANGEKISSVERLRAIVGGNRKHIALLVLRDERKIFVPIPLG